jgi:hypothetical protein
MGNFRETSFEVNTDMRREQLRHQLGPDGHPVLPSTYHMFDVYESGTYFNEYDQPVTKDIVDIPEYFKEAPKLSHSLTYSRSEINMLRNSHQFIEKHEREIQREFEEIRRDQEKERAEDAAITKGTFNFVRHISLDQQVMPMD